MVHWPGPQMRQVWECLTDEFTRNSFKLISRHLPGQAGADSFGTQTDENTLGYGDADRVAAVRVGRDTGLIGS